MFANCKGAHSSISKICAMHCQELEIRSVETSQNITIQEARLRVVSDLDFLILSQIMKQTPTVINTAQKCGSQSREVNRSADSSRDGEGESCSSA